MDDKKRLQSVRNKVREERDKVKNSVIFISIYINQHLETRNCIETEGEKEEEGDQ